MYESGSQSKMRLLKLSWGLPFRLFWPLTYLFWHEQNHCHHIPPLCSAASIWADKAAVPLKKITMLCPYPKKSHFLPLQISVTSPFIICFQFSFVASFLYWRDAAAVTSYQGLNDWEEYTIIKLPFVLEVRTLGWIHWVTSWSSQSNISEGSEDVRVFTSSAFSLAHGFLLYAQCQKQWDLSQEVTLKFSYLLFPSLPPLPWAHLESSSLICFQPD